MFTERIGCGGKKLFTDVGANPNPRGGGAGKAVCLRQMWRLSERVGQSVAPCGRGLLPTRELGFRQQTREAKPSICDPVLCAVPNPGPPTVIGCLPALRGWLAGVWAMCHAILRWTSRFPSTWPAGVSSLCILNTAFSAEAYRREPSMRRWRWNVERACQCWAHRLAGVPGSNAVKNGCSSGQGRC